MSKAHRGFGLRELKSHGRGTCPVCKRSGIKTVYEQAVGDKKVMVCKQCRAAIGHGKKQEALAAL
jgi:ribosomal protein L7/L12